MGGNFLAVIGLATVFAIVMAVGQGFYWTYVTTQQRERDRLARRLGTLSEEEAEQVLFASVDEQAKNTGLGAIGEHLQHIITEAESTSTPAMVLLQGVAIAAVTAIVFLIVQPAAMVIAPLAGLVPYILLRNAAATRRKKLLEQLPDALDLMSRSLQAGLGLSDAFKMCAEEMPLPLAGEFGRVFEQIRFGRDYRAALGQMIERNPGLFELRIFVSSVLLQRETGGNLIEILSTISNTIRQRFLFQAKVRAMTAEAKFSALILGALPLTVAALISVINPSYFEPLFTEAIGNVLVAFMIGLYSVGGFLMYALSNVEV